MATPVLFYRLAEEYGAFSNFARYSFEKDGYNWQTSEHYYQAQKFKHSPEDFHAVRLAPNPSACAKIGRDTNRPLRADWEEVKESVMYDAIKAKFSQAPGLRDLLLSTGDAYIAEHTDVDTYWGDGLDGSGKNRLGHLLMQLRAEFSGETA